MLRALRTLRDEGLLEFRRGRGITVAGTLDRSAVTSRARDLLTFAQKHGYGRPELVQIIEDLNGAISIRPPADGCGGGVLMQARTRGDLRSAPAGRLAGAGMIGEAIRSLPVRGKGKAHLKIDVCT